MPRHALARLEAPALPPVTVLARTAAGVILALALTACGGGEPSSDAADQGGGQDGAEEATADSGATAVIATVTGDGVDVYEEKDGAKLTTLASPNEYGADRTFLVAEKDGEWLNVLLPVRPNGSTGWVRESDVELSRTDRRMEVDLAEHVFTVYKGDEVEREGEIGTGRDETPTPPGTYYFTELVEPAEDDSPYGAYAYGLSGFSPTLETFAGGPGQLAVHGTNANDDLGTQVSHGCVRVSNDDITWIAENLALGTPVIIG
ncbi:L,D-transpeptidase [Actinorugispora endophytica]|uniref:Lipoprotein-anchoring transpeptidase ErfK/SrfK n=1 Tax=Actinorugispora endophytica TaxID=1605990 RepID=A0A4V3D8X5_9ACTN|nr:L,D-transpeptidase [Actinorugispora endophytica]TDQ53439.1 lipoprotein-anchoring transpeptidase ErfK/SrfK [Actinorugispora endophytica]